MIMMMSTTTRVNGNNVQYHEIHHRRGHSFNAIPSNLIINNSSDHHLIFSNNTTRPTLSSATSSDHGTLVVSSQKLGKLFAESEKLATSGFDDLLSSSTDGGNHDYDWLLTPPRSPDFQAPFRSSLGEPTSYVNNNNNASSSSSRRAQISENKNESRAGRKSSVSRCSFSRTTSSQNRTSLSSMLHTSSASPITPRPLRSPSAAASRLATTISSSSSADKTRPSQIPRPYTAFNSHQSPPSPARSFSTSRASTPTRRHSTPAPSPSSAALISKYCNSEPIIPPRSSSASRRRGLQQAVVPADFPVETPPNLRTTLPADRPVSAGRSRPASTLKAKAQGAASCSSARRQPSPIARSRNGHQYHEEPPSPSPSEAVAIAIARRSLINNKAASSSSTTTSATHPTDSNNNNGIGIGTGTGRTISKKSLDMAIKHMEMIRRSSSGSLRSSTLLFPQSIRTTSAASKDEQDTTTKRDNNNKKRWSL